MKTRCGAESDLYSRRDDEVIKSGLRGGSLGLLLLYGTGDEYHGTGLMFITLWINSLDNLPRRLFSRSESRSMSLFDSARLHRPRQSNDFVMFRRRLCASVQDCSRVVPHSQADGRKKLQQNPYPDGVGRYGMTLVCY